VFAKHAGNAIVTGGAFDPVDRAVAYEQHVGWRSLDTKPFRFRAILSSVDAVDGEAIAAEPPHSGLHSAAVRAVFRDKLQDDSLVAWRFEPRDKGRPQQDGRQSQHGHILPETRRSFHPWNARVEQCVPKPPVEARSKSGGWKRQRRPLVCNGLR
jgi:hypothetical protein